jgi:hypothetical protein
VRGTGFLHDGSVPTLLNFFSIAFEPIPPFTFPDAPGRPRAQKVRELEAFLFTFNTGLAPVVGHQSTIAAAAGFESAPRLAVFRDRAAAGDCDLVAFGRVAGERRGFLYVGGAGFQADSRAAAVVPEEEFLDGFAAGAMVTFTAVPPGSGRRIALDRDRDGHFNRDEIEAGSDPADPESVPSQRRFLRGDCNGDEAIDIADPVYGLFILVLGAGPAPCQEACNASGDGGFNLADVVALLIYLFKDGPAIPAPFPGCDGASAGCDRDTCPAGG